MNELVRAVREALERDTAPLEALAAAGEADPARAAAQLASAARCEDLRPERDAWLGALLATARPGFGAQCLEELAGRYRQTRGRRLDLSTAPSLAQVLGSSDFLARLLLRHPHWAEDVAGDPPHAPLAHAVEPDWTTIRIAKYRGLLRIAARDLAGRPFAESPGELSDLADRCLTAAVECAARETGVAAPTLVALGKLGGRELNFSSDVDVMFLYEPPPDREELAHNRDVAQSVLRIKSNLEAPSEDGFGYRVDLDLRPEGRSGALANSVSAALYYYETFGEEWERQMLIRARWVAGPRTVADAFWREIEPFVYRTLIDPQAIARVRTMKAMIEEDRRRKGSDLEYQLKDGPGGIRDVEFLVQALQLFLGGSHPKLRTGNVLEALGRIEELRLLPPHAADELRDAYLWLRRAEHALQLPEERQTARVPRERRAQLGLARRMGYADAEGARALARMLDDWSAVRSRVRAHFEALVLESRGGPA
jgi:glutamate-ammonia-ligase adenylyltransferase